MAISRVNTTELRVQVYNYLVDQILNGDLKPGDSIAESKLASEFNISRTPVREAVRQLAASGIWKANRIAIRLSPSGMMKKFFNWKLSGRIWRIWQLSLQLFMEITVSFRKCINLVVHVMRRGKIII